MGKAVGSTGRLYWPDLSGVSMNETSLTGTGGVRNVYVGSVQAAREDSRGNWIYPLQDHLGSTRAVLNSSGAKVYDVDYYPYGTAAYSSGSTTNLYEFTGYETDTESGTNYAVFRNQSGTLGRFLRPDPYDGSYNITEPKSLNRYSYVGNRPLMFTDPQGMYRCVTSTSYYQGNVIATNTVCYWTDFSIFTTGEGGPNYSNWGQRGVGGGPSPSNFTKKYLPPGCQSCSAIFKKFSRRLLSDYW